MLVLLTKDSFPNSMILLEFQCDLVGLLGGAFWMIEYYNPRNLRPAVTKYFLSPYFLLVQRLWVGILYSPKKFGSYFFKPMSMLPSRKKTDGKRYFPDVTRVWVLRWIIQIILDCRGKGVQSNLIGPPWWQREAEGGLESCNLRT